jgi:hypothetical protein
MRQWMQNEVVGSKQLLEQRLGIKVNCFAVPFGNYNEHVKEIARKSGYEAMFTVYGQPDHLYIATRFDRSLCD